MTKSDRRHSQYGPGRACRVRARPCWPRRSCSGPAAIRAKGSLARGTTVCDHDPQARRLLHSVDATLCWLETGECPRQSRRHARLSRLHRPHAADAGGGRDRGGRRQCRRRRRADVAAHDGCGPRPRACAASSSSTRSTPATPIPRRRSRKSASSSAANACRSTCRPAAARRSSTAFSITTARRPISRRSRRRTREIIDQVVEVDDELMALYLEQGEELAPEQLHDPFEKALREGHLVPVCFVSAETGAGIPELLEVIARLMPNPGRGQPAAVPERRGRRGGARRRSSPDPGAPRDRARVQGHHGSVRRQARAVPRPPGDDPRRARSSSSATGASPCKVAHLFRMQGKEHARCRRPCPATSARSPSSTSCISTPCCTTRTTRTIST